jgi:hypothetical protein
MPHAKFSAWLSGDGVAPPFVRARSACAPRAVTVITPNSKSALTRHQPAHTSPARTPRQTERASPSASLGGSIATIASPTVAKPWEPAATHSTHGLRQMPLPRRQAFVSWPPWQVRPEALPFVGPTSTSSTGPSSTTSLLGMLNRFPPTSARRRTRPPEGWCAMQRTSTGRRMTWTLAASRAPPSEHRGSTRS